MKTDSKYDWLQKLKAGDEVALNWNHWRDWPDIAVVDRTTAKFVIVRGDKFRKEDGRLAGDRYRKNIVQLTDEIRKGISEHERRRDAEYEFEALFVDGRGYRKMPADWLENAVKAMKKIQGERTGDE